MKTPQEIKDRCPKAEVTVLPTGKVLVGFPNKNWIDVPSRGEIRHLTGAYAVHQINVSDGKVWFGLLEE